METKISFAWFCLMLAAAIALSGSRAAQASYAGGEMVYDAASKVWNIKPVGGTLTTVPTAQVATAANASTFRNVATVGSTVSRIVIPVIGAATVGYMLYSLAVDPETPDGWSDPYTDPNAPQPIASYTTYYATFDPNIGGAGLVTTIYGFKTSQEAAEMYVDWLNANGSAYAPYDSPQSTDPGDWRANVQFRYTNSSGNWSWATAISNPPKGEHEYNQCPSGYTLNGSTCEPNNGSAEWPADGHASYRSASGSWSDGLDLYDPDPYVDIPPHWITTNPNGHRVVTFVEPKADGGIEWKRQSEATADDGTTWTVTEQFVTDANGEIVSSSTYQEPGSLESNGVDPEATSQPVVVEMDTSDLAKETTLQSLLTEIQSQYDNPEALANAEPAEQTLTDAQADIETDLESYGSGLPAGMPAPLAWQWGIGGGAACQGIPWEFNGATGTWDNHCNFWDTILEPAASWFFIMLTIWHLWGLFFRPEGS